jgi:Uma2 family endonuclease
MTAVIADPRLEDRLIADRRAQGLDRWDEVWDGTYMIMPLPNDEHQEIAGGVSGVLTVEIQLKGLGLVRPGVNVTDREDNWEENFRCPDVVVFLPDTHTVNRETNWLGGPDFAVEVVSSGDHTREKLSFMKASAYVSC